MMSRRDYEAIAALINRLSPGSITTAPPITKADLVVQMAAMFQYQNENFDADKWKHIAQTYEVPS